MRGEDGLGDVPFTVVVDEGVRAKCYRGSSGNEGGQETVQTHVTPPVPSAVAAAGPRV